MEINVTIHNLHSEVGQINRSFFTGSKKDNIKILPGKLHKITALAYLCVVLKFSVK